MQTSGAPSCRDPYDALVVVSPMCLGGDRKDQDRAAWFGPGQIAAVADGVTTSPCAGQAAELAVSFSAVLFQDEPAERLRVLCDLLVAHRHDFARAPLVVPVGTPAGMREMLEDVARQQRQISFQTTLVAAQFGLIDDCVTATVVRCGDSAFMAFSPEGTCLASSLVTTPPRGDPAESEDGHTPPVPERIRFGPGDELLVKVLGSAADRPLLAQMAGVRREIAHNWLICAPLDRCAGVAQGPGRPPKDSRVLWLQPGDLLLVPHYVVGKPRHAKDHPYCRLAFSGAIRPIQAAPGPPGPVGFEHGGNSTPVLPDHFFTDWWTLVRERFPRGTQFVLATDGFYGGFAGPAELWVWLHENKTTLHGPEVREPLLEDLHTRLHARRGDDDISFVWAYPVEAADHGDADAR